jgi:phosphate/sulfate permease
MGTNTFGTIAAILGMKFSAFHSKLAVVVSMVYGIVLFNLFGELRKTKLMESFDVYQITCVQLGCGASVILFSVMGIPVSIIHALMAGLITVAFIKRMNIVKKKMEHVLLRNLLFVPLLSLFAGVLAGFVFF